MRGILRQWPIIAGVVVGVAGFLSFYLLDESAEATQAADGYFELVNTQGETVTPEDFRGEYMLVLFGYTYCPDVCPTTLLNITQALDQLAVDVPEMAESITPVFITVDPERDTVEAMKDYVEHFHPRTVGLTGNPEQIEQAAQAYEVAYWRVDSEDTAEYTMAHTAFTFLTDPSGELIARFDPELPAGDMAEALAAKVSGDTTLSGDTTVSRDATAAAGMVAPGEIRSSLRSLLSSYVKAIETLTGSSYVMCV